MTEREKAMKKQENLVELWKGTILGTPVVVTLDDGEERHTRTRSAAQLLGGHTAVIWLEDITGCYSLDRVRLDR